MKRSLFLPGIKDVEFDPYRKNRQTKRKIITLMIALPLLFLAEHLLFDMSFHQYWMIMMFAYVCFFVVPFAIGVCVKAHLWNKLLINIFIPIICMILLLVIWRRTGGSQTEELWEILIATGKMIFIGSCITTIGHIIHERIIIKN